MQRKKLPPPRRGETLATVEPEARDTEAPRHEAPAPIGLATLSPLGALAWRHSPLVRHAGRSLCRSLLLAALASIAASEAQEGGG